MQYSYRLQLSHAARPSPSQTRHSQTRHAKQRLRGPGRHPSYLFQGTRPKEATILPLKKAGKRPGPSPRTDLLASHNVFSRQWREWCTTACITWLRQEDDFEANRPKRSLMALLNVSKAVNRVGREERLLAASFF